MKPILAVPAIGALLYRSYSKKSLTPAGIAAALVTAVAHAVHPWNLPFVLLAVFFLAGTRATHVKENVKAHLTLPANGPSGSGGEGPRTHVQVFANSLVASVLSLLHTYQLYRRRQVLAALPAGAAAADSVGSLCYAWGGDLLVIGIVANYACVAADTFSSELGILSGETPRLITSWRLRQVPRGTNGGVTLGGLAAGLLGAVIVITAVMLFLPLCADNTAPVLLGGRAAATAIWTDGERRLLMMGLAVWGLLGSLLDSVLGGLLQRSVRDVHSGKIVEGAGGKRVLVAEQPHMHMHGQLVDVPEAAVDEADEAKKHDDDDDDKDAAAARAAAQVPPTARYDPHTRHRRPSFGDYRPSRVVENGWDLLDNNEVNLLMATTMSVGAMAVAGWYWGVPLSSVWSV